MRQHILGLAPDVVHAHDLVTLPTASAAAARIGAKLVYDSHELEMHRNARYPKLGWWRRRILERRHIRQADLVITVCDSIADHLAEDYGIACPTVILNTPPLPLADRVSRRTLRGHLGLARDVPLVVYVGKVTAGRGIEHCVRALALAPELHLAVVGPRLRPTENLLRGLSEKLAVTDRLHLVDPVPPDEVAGFIGDADAGVVPIQNVCLSYYYCLPSKLFESVFAGLPVAVADLRELRRFVLGQGCGVVMDQTDPRDIARAMREAIAHRERYRLTGARLRAVQDAYAWPAQARKLVAAYARLVPGAHRKQSAPVPALQRE